jgi:hypothetical protein
VTSRPQDNRCLRNRHAKVEIALMFPDLHVAGSALRINLIASRRRHGIQTCQY